MFFDKIASPRRALLLSPHTDDCELAMGGTIARLKDNGYEIYWHTFSNAWQSLPAGFDKETLPTEQSLACKSLGIDAANLTQHDFPVRNFPEYRQDILEVLVGAGREINPDVVFCPTVEDCHQDHATIANEALRAFKRKSLLGYILPWNVTREVRTCYVEISEENFVKKVAALEEYKSQMSRSYFGAEQVELLLKANGIHIGVEYAECFEVMRSVYRV